MNTSDANTSDAREPDSGSPSGGRAIDGGPSARSTTDLTAQPNRVDRTDDHAVPVAPAPLGATPPPDTAAEPADTSEYALVGDEPGFSTTARGSAEPPVDSTVPPGDSTVPPGAVPGEPAADRSTSSGPTAAGAASSDEPEGDWRQVLIDFVDHPRQAVEKADRLVDEAVRSLTDRISREHSGLRSAWHDHGEPSTEDLRKALRGYREFFEKVLSTH
ncbi:flagellar biosynthesis protein FlhF [Parafrankia discariae]|uniref:hypothetical protein n=1 Tax=Parafrankia discariae TaxID=365528 RepID=UPI000371C7D7|nr:hypothetical protein [Parafrankia discariae]